MHKILYMGNLMILKSHWDKLIIVQVIKELWIEVGIKLVWKMSKSCSEMLIHWLPYLGMPQQPITGEEAITWQELANPVETASAILV